MKLAPVPVAGLPPGADQANVYGDVPPVADALHVTGLPAVAAPHVTVTTIGWAATTTVACPSLVTALLSLAVALTTCEPFVAKVVV